MRRRTARHREVLLVQLGLSSARGVTTPFEKGDVDDSTMGTSGRRCGRDFQKRSHTCSGLLCRVLSSLGQKMELSGRTQLLSYRVLRDGAMFPCHRFLTGCTSSPPPSLVSRVGLLRVPVFQTSHFSVHQPVNYIRK